MDARQKEAECLKKCLLAAKAKTFPLDANEASIFIVAAKLLKGLYPASAAQLEATGVAYLATTHEKQLKCEDMIRSGLIAGLPRFKSMLEQTMKRDRDVH
jgi:hypothetical protein